MSPGAILIGLGLLVLAIPCVVGPLLPSRRRLVPFSKPARRKINRPEGDIPASQHVFAALRDLEFDHQTGKINDVDFEQTRAPLLVEAAKIIQHRQEAKSAAIALDQELETLLQARRKAKKQAIFCPHCGKSLHLGDQFCSSCGSLVGTQCPSCQGTISNTDRFCPGCGTEVNQKGTKVKELN